MSNVAALASSIQVSSAVGNPRANAPSSKLGRAPSASPVNAEIWNGCPHCSSLVSSVVMEFCEPVPTSKWKIAQCQDCALMYTLPRPSETEIAESYPSDYFAYRASRKRFTWHSKLRNRLRAALTPTLSGREKCSQRIRRQAMLSRTPLFGRLFEFGMFAPFGDGSILDIGCGSGQFLANMRSLGWDVLGADRSAAAAERAMETLSVPVAIGNFPDIDLPADSFDLVTAWQVLEHLDTPRASLAKIRTLLRINGKLLITVPNQASWGAKRFGSQWIGNDLPRHLTHFSRETLDRMLQAEGFEVLFLGTIGQSGWIRRSAREVRRENRTIVSRLLQSRLASTLYTTAANYNEAGETLLAVATPVKSA